MRRRIGTACVISVLLLVSGCSMEARGIPSPENSPSPTPEAQVPIMDSVSEEIHINQVGYRPRDIKIVRVPGVYSVFYVMDCDTGEAVYEGEFEAVKADKGAKEDVAAGDFTAVREPGRYAVQVPGLRRSYEFCIEEDVYAGLSRAVLKMLFYQRCGAELVEAYAGQWAHPACHTEPGEIYGEEGTPFDGQGGWHDAGDYGRYTVPAARTVADLFLAYRLYPESFGDDTHIPESGNGIPDILDEAKVGVEWLLKMQEEHSGGVYHKYTPKGFPVMEIMPLNDRSRFYAIGISPTATGSFCAVMAQAARVYREIDGEFADRCLRAAKEAYAWMRANPNAPAYQNPDGVVTGDYRDTSHRDEYYWASMEMYVITGEQSYLEDADPYGDHSTLYWSDTLELYDVSLLGTLACLLSDTTDKDSDLYREMRADVIRVADEITGYAEKNGYGIHMAPEDYVWGSNGIVAGRAVMLLCANYLAPNEAYLRTARAHFDYLLGCNALNQCYVTGFGSRPILRPHHRPTVADMVKEPIPGMVSGGPNAHREDPIARSSLAADTPPAKCFLDDTGAYSLNEVTTYWNSPMILLCAHFNGADE